MVKILIRLGFIFSLLTILPVAKAQDTGRLVIHQQEGITNLLEKHKTINEKKQQIHGWRVQIFSVSGVGSKEKAEEVLEKFNKAYPDLNAYIVYNAPYFRVRVGNCRNQINALYLLQMITINYPYGFPVRDIIMYPSFY